MTARPGRRAPRLTLVAGRGHTATDHNLARNRYGLSIREARAEIRRLTARGWQLWEIRSRFYDQT
ncbi:hypothetical protein [Streptomyces yokosukanensis]|uniref:hypothetical protein n=1 Tax=Streptomyces yokosukanensis TaxID=67386 RepID=UPI00082F01F5|nr:hypothetical protein [Streptomyces yokosukanensis]